MGYTALNAVNMFVGDETVRHHFLLFSEYMNKPGVTEIAINRPGEIFYKTFSGWNRVLDEAISLDFCNALAISTMAFNRQKHAALNSVVFPDGERGQVNNSPATLPGVITFNIRIPSAVVKSLDQLADEGAFASIRDVSFNKPDEQTALEMMSRNDFSRLEIWEVELLRLKREEKWVEFLKKAMESYQNVVCVGGTGSGKTTFMRSMLEEVSTDERIVTMEDVHELFLPNHHNRVALFFGDGGGKVPPRDCLKAAMRMTPDRIIPAELRGDEAWEYILAMNTGHPGSITSIHANSAIEMYGRMFGLVKSSPIGRELDSQFVKDEIAKTINISLYFENRKLLQVFYDPIFTKSKMI